MLKTTITKTAKTEVTLVAIGPMSGEVICRVFWIPTSGGYVREGKLQVCTRLGSRGNTLTATNGDDLLQTIRREWKAYRNWAKNELKG